MDSVSANLDLMGRWETAFPGRLALGRELLHRYEQVTRVYHDVQHLAEVLVAIDELSGEASRPDLVELAAWFHDAVYDVRRDDNEAQSAELAERTLPAYEVAEPDAAEVARLVLLTRRHDPAPGDADGSVLCDADLAVLASEPGRYATYCDAVRVEYRHVNDGTFRAGRATVLRQLLDLPRLYRTEQGHTRWEARARVNVEDELAKLEATGPR